MIKQRNEITISDFYHRLYDEKAHIISLGSKLKLSDRTTKKNADRDEILFIRANSFCREMFEIIIIQKTFFFFFDQYSFLYI